MKKHLNKELKMAKKTTKTLRNCNKCWVCANAYVYGDVKVGDHCHITGKYRGCTYRDCIINVKLNHKIPVVFNNLQKL